jgi:hypothetical protein
MTSSVRRSESGGRGLGRATVGGGQWRAMAVAGWLAALSVALSRATAGGCVERLKNDKSMGRIRAVTVSA